MALSRPLFVGFSSASRQAREGGDLEVTVQTAGGPRTFLLPWFFVRDVDALLERWRREEHEAALLTRNWEHLGATLCEAARAGGVRDTVFLLARGADVEHRQEMTSLHFAAQRGHLAVVRALLDAGAGERGHALYLSALNGFAPTVTLLLDHGVDIHYMNGTPLRSAASQGDLEMVRLLLARGAFIEADDNSAFLAAARSGRIEMMHMLLYRGADVNGHARQTAFREAARAGRADVMRALLDLGADVSAENNEALRTAAFYGFDEALQLVLDRGADLHVSDGFALRAAAERGHLQTVRLLLDRGADVHAQFDGALRAARKEGRKAIITLLLKRGAVDRDAWGR